MIIYLDRWPHYGETCGLLVGMEKFDGLNGLMVTGGVRKIKEPTISS